MMDYEDDDVKSILQAAQDLYGEQQSCTVRDYDQVGVANPAKDYANDLITFVCDQGWWEHWEAWEWSVFRNELVRLGLEDIEEEE